LNVQIKGHVAFIEVTQTYENESENPIECSFSYPFDSKFPILDIEAKLGEFIVKTKVVDKEEAKEKYNDAIASSDFTFHAHYDEENSDVLNLNLGCLNPSERATIKISMMNQLDLIADDTLSFMFPKEFLCNYDINEVKFDIE